MIRTLRKGWFLLITVLIILIIVSFSISYILLSSQEVPEAREFCGTWGIISCGQVGTLSDNWDVGLKLRENGAVVWKSCLDVMGCGSCPECGFP
jgi:hypothetical protein